MQQSLETHARPRWLVPSFASSVGLFLIGLAADLEAMRLVFKALPVLVLAAWVWSFVPKTRYRMTVTVALLLGAAGDLLLELDLFVPGLVAFLIGHLFYIRAFLGDERRLGSREAVPFLVWGVALVVALADGAGDLLVPVAVYATVLCVMMWRAVTRVTGVTRPSGLTTAVGAVLFGISDSIIAVDRFGPSVTAAPWLIVLTYWAAQFLLAEGAIRHDS